MKIHETHLSFQVTDDHGNHLTITRAAGSLVFSANESEVGEVTVGQVHFPYLAAVSIHDPKDAAELGTALVKWLMAEL